MTDAEARVLINELKELIARRFEIPQIGYSREYEIKGINNPKFKFIFVMQRKGTVNPDKCTYIVRDKKTGINLLRLDIGSRPHRNPDGTVLRGPHLHIYKEEYYYTNTNLPYAIEFDINNPSLIENCIAFLKEFNVIEYPTLIEQPALLLN